MKSASPQPIQDHATEFFSDDRAALELEDRLWWFAGRRHILRRYLDRARARRPIERIVEIGCGSGGQLPLLAEYGEVTGIERSETLARRARSRDVAREVLTNDFFDIETGYDYQLTCLFDVLEHMEDDARFFRKLGTLAGPGHQVLLSVPACPSLYGPHDVLLHHYRRYSRPALRSLLERNGYRVVELSHFMFFMFPVAALMRIKDRIAARLGRPLKAVELGEVSPWLNTLFGRLLELESRLSRNAPLPVGLWLIALAEKV